MKNWIIYALQTIFHLIFGSFPFQFFPNFLNLFPTFLAHFRVILTMMKKLKKQRPQTLNSKKMQRTKKKSGVLYNLQTLVLFCLFDFSNKNIF